MATQTYEQLIAGANKIKENELPESNTHDLVGEQLLQMTNKMQEENSNNEKKFSELEIDIISTNLHQGIIDDFYSGFYIAGKLLWQAGDAEFYIYRIKPQDVIKIESDAVKGTFYALLTDVSNIFNGASPNFCVEYPKRYSVKGEVTIIAPDDAKYLYILKRYTTNNYILSKLTINNTVVGLKKYIDEVKNTVSKNTEDIKLSNTSLSYSKFFSLNKTFGLDSISDINLYKTALLDIYFYDIIKYDRIAIYSYQLISGINSFILMLANCDTITDNDKILLDNVFAKTIYTVKDEDKGILKIPLVNMKDNPDEIGYVIIDIDKVKNATQKIESSTNTTYSNSGINKDYISGLDAPERYYIKTSNELKVFYKRASQDYICYHLYKRYMDWNQSVADDGTNPNYYDNWGIEMLTQESYNNGVFKTIRNLYLEGETELALQIKGEAYIGGKAHGYENISKTDGIRDFQIFINGTLIGETSESQGIFDNIEINMRTLLSRMQTKTNICQANKQWIFSKDGLRINIGIKFLVEDLEVAHCQMPMLLCLRKNGNLQITDKAVKGNNIYKIYDVSEDNWVDEPANMPLRARSKDAKYIREWSDDFSFTLSIEEATYKEGGGMFVTTNQGAYNKIYNDIGSYTTNTNDVVSSNAIFSIL